jgi:hypothetical protein
VIPTTAATLGSALRFRRDAEEPVNQPEPVRTLRGGRYVVVGTLGEGAQGATLDAVDKRVGRPVAVKEFRVRGARSWKDVELAEREARVLQTLSHPNLPVYIDHFEEDGALFVVTERIDGEPLNRIRKRGERLDQAGVRRFLGDAASALEYLHGKTPPVVHRDIKPGNVLRRPDGSFAFVDFGSVRDNLKPEGGSTVVGTFGYMAPEQFQGRAGPGSDVYAVGATALALLTGCEPEDLPHRGLAIDVPQALAGLTDPKIVRILSAMLEPDPDRRPTRIAPLLVEVAAEPAPRSVPPRSRLHDDFRDEARRQAREVRDEAEQWRAWEREWKDWGRQWGRSTKRQRKRARRHMPGGPFLPLLFLALMLARIGNWAVFRVLVPVFLSLLSVVFGRELRVAARNVRDLGRANDDSLNHAAERLRKATMPSVDVRVETTPSGKRRVEDVEVLEAEEIDSDDDHRASRRHRA